MTVTAVVLAYGLLPVLAAGDEIDLLKPSGQRGRVIVWKAFHEDPAAKLEDVWQFRGDGVLTCKGTPKGYIYFENPFDDYLLTLEWRWPPEKGPGRGGVLLRMTGGHCIWPKSLEAQINAGDAGDFWGLMGYQLNGPEDRLTQLEHDQFGRLTNVKKTAAVEKPAGEWNRYQIRVEGDVVTLTINGTVVNRATECEVVRGRICLTSEGDPIHFRNVRLTPIKASGT
jgi:hypothetical protein